MQSGSPASGSSAATPSRSSAPIGRGSTGRSWRRRCSVPCRCRSMPMRWPRSSPSCWPMPRCVSRPWRTRSRSTRSCRSRSGCRSSRRSSTTSRAACATTTTAVCTPSTMSSGTAVPRSRGMPVSAQWLDREIEAGKGSDTSIILYTSGTTGQSKGVVLSASGCINAASDTVAFDQLTERDEALAYLPLAWVGDHYLNYAQALVAGFCLACPESADTATARHAGDRSDLLFRSAARIRADAHPRHDPHGGCGRRSSDACSTHFSRVARRYGEKILDREPVPLGGRLLYALGELLVYGPLKNMLGLSRVRIAYTAGEAIGPDLFSFYRSIGLNLKQLYGQTEAFLYLTAQPDGKIYSDTVGPVMPNVDLRIAENGEVLFKSPGHVRGIFQGRGQDRRGHHRRRLRQDRRRRLHRSQDRSSQDHRPGQGRRPSQRRHAVRAEIHREQAQVLSQHPRGGGLWRPARLRLRHAQHRPHRGRQLGRAQQHRLWLLPGAGGASAGLRHAGRSTSRR